MKGRLRRSLKERCPECNSFLQVRATEVTEIRNGFQVFVSEEYVTCPDCSYTRPVEQKRRRRQEDDLMI